MQFVIWNLKVTLQNMVFYWLSDFMRSAVHCELILAEKNWVALAKSMWGQRLNHRMRDMSSNLYDCRWSLYYRRDSIFVQVMTVIEHFPFYRNYYIVPHLYHYKLSDCCLFNFITTVSYYQFNIKVTTYYPVVNDLTINKPFLTVIRLIRGSSLQTTVSIVMQ